MASKEENVELTETVEEVSPMVIYHQDKAAIDMQISTAKAYPRDIKKATANAITIVTMDVETAKTCTYSVPRGQKPITGPSIHLAKILAQVWGNLRIESKVISIDNKHVTSESVCFDLENNLAWKAQVKRSILQNEYKGGQKTGKMTRMNDDMITVTGNAANSIAARNAILAVIPRAIVDKVYNESKKMLVGDSTELLARRKQVIEALKKAYSINEKEILQAIDRKEVGDITADDLVVLIGIGTAIKEGDTTVELAFKTKKEEKKTGAEKKEAIKGNDKIDMP